MKTPTLTKVLSAILALAPITVFAQDAEPAAAEPAAADSSQVVFSEAQTEAQVEAAASQTVESLEELVSGGGEAATEAIEAAADAVESSGLMDAGTAESALGDLLPLIEPEGLPEAASQFLPDDSLLMDSPGYIPSYDEIVRQSRDVLRATGAEPGLEMRQNIAVRKARTKAMADPDVQAALDNAHAQLYHADKQAAWKEYYDLLYKKMERADKSLSDKLDAMRNEDYSRLGLPVAAAESPE